MLCKEKEGAMGPNASPRARTHILFIMQLVVLYFSPARDQGGVGVRCCLNVKRVFKFVDDDKRKNRLCLFLE